ncbi:MAG TPA: hypothetical protein VGU23_10485 [Acidobacteriaceae bacterium]|nr:hypothetical protein [Acidobacteriaceae bacterium]
MATTPSYPIRLRTSRHTPFAGGGMRAAGLIPLRPVPNRQPSPRLAHQLILEKEPEDARLTGGTRSLDRRLLALNLYGKAIKAKLLPPRAPALQCSTAA